MNEYEILGRLHEIIDDDTNLKMKEWLDSHNVNDYLRRPRAARARAASRHMLSAR